MNKINFVFTTLLLLSTQAFAHGLEDATDVELVREVLLRGIEVDESKIGTISAICKGSSLQLTVASESNVTQSTFIHFAGGVNECLKNLNVIQGKIGTFYNKQIISVCSGSSLIDVTIDSSLEFTNSAPLYLGVEKCLRVAALNNAH